MEEFVDKWNAYRFPSWVFVATFNSCEMWSQTISLIITIQLSNALLQLAQFTPLLSNCPTTIEMSSKYLQILAQILGWLAEELYSLHVVNHVGWAHVISESSLSTFDELLFLSFCRVSVSASFVLKSTPIMKFWENPLSAISALFQSISEESLMNQLFMKWPN